jgi:hypothetical protein
MLGLPPRRHGLRGLRLRVVAAASVRPRRALGTDAARRGDTPLPPYRRRLADDVGGAGGAVASGSREAGGGAAREPLQPWWRAASAAAARALQERLLVLSERVHEAADYVGRGARSRLPSSLGTGTLGALGSQQAQSYAALRDSIRRLDSSMQYKNYHTLRWSAGLLGVGALGLYLYRDDVKKSFGTTTADLTSSTLRDHGVQREAQNLAQGVVYQLLNDPRSVQLTTDFLNQLLEREDTRAAVLALLAGVAARPETQELFQDLFIRVLSSPGFIAETVRFTAEVLRRESTKDALRDLFNSYYQDEWAQQQTATFFQTVINSAAFRDASAQLGQDSAHQVLDDAAVAEHAVRWINAVLANPDIHSKAGDAIWGALTSSFVPGFLGGGRAKKGDVVDINEAVAALREKQKQDAAARAAASSGGVGGVGGGGGGGGGATAAVAPATSSSGGIGHGHGGAVPHAQAQASSHAPAHTPAHAPAHEPTLAPPHSPAHPPAIRQTAVPAVQVEEKLEGGPAPAELAAEIKLVPPAPAGADSAAATAQSAGIPAAAALQATAKSPQAGAAPALAPAQVSSAAPAPGAGHEAQVSVPESAPAGRLEGLAALAEKTVPPGKPESSPGSAGHGEHNEGK